MFSVQKRSMIGLGLAQSAEALKIENYFSGKKTKHRVQSSVQPHHMFSGPVSLLEMKSNPSVDSIEPHDEPKSKEELDKLKQISIESTLERVYKEIVKVRSELKLKAREEFDRGKKGGQGTLSLWSKELEKMVTIKEFSSQVYKEILIFDLKVNFRSQLEVFKLPVFQTFRLASEKVDELERWMRPRFCFMVGKMVLRNVNQAEKERIQEEVQNMSGPWKLWLRLRNNL